MKFYDLFRSVKDGIIDLDNLPQQDSYIVNSIKVDLKHINDDGLEKHIINKINNIGLYRNEYIYQGCLVVGKGPKQMNDLLCKISQAVHISNKDFPKNTFRATHYYKKAQDPASVTLHFIFSHNRFIKSYFYARDDWIHILTPKLTTKFIKQNKDIKREDWRDGVRIFYLEESDEIDEKFKRKLKKESKGCYPIAILVKWKRTYERIKEFEKNIKLNRQMIFQGSWV
ncbi:hypothetical protein K9M79_01785 [Candidatus Woesearchaeota archaeon]|nr:hypothetical protein [Candidatus Woesearchaeota archaeon]